MKRIFLALCAVMIAAGGMAQNSYIVKTKNVKKTAVKQKTDDGGGNEEKAEEEETATDFIGKNFRFRSLCDWTKGMRFMVMPEKYDLIVNTFCLAETGKEVSSGRLRYKIMEYQDHTVADDGTAHVNFLCIDDGKAYYYPIPNGTFEDYCFGKMGVPTLAYLGDVDIARTKLLGAKMYTKATLFRIDTEFDGDGFQEINVPKNSEVTVKAIGVGTRSYPVKIIVADKSGREFYQNIAMSKTNSGMRDDEFIMDKTKFTFYGSFELIDENVAAASEYAKYINQEVYTKYRTTMEDSEGKKVTVPKLSSFVIKKIEQAKGKYVKMTLNSVATGAAYTKLVTFVNENVAGDIDGQREDYYGFLFGAGTADLKNVSKAHMAAVQEGRIVKGFNKTEVKLAKGEPQNTAKANNGREDWIYGDGTIVKFNSKGKVYSVER